jgi:hypothetical protein
MDNAINRTGTSLVSQRASLMFTKVSDTPPAAEDNDPTEARHTAQQWIR